MHLIGALILTADLVVYLAGLADLYCRLFWSSNRDTLNLTIDIWIWNGAYGGCDRSEGIAHCSAAPDPTYVFIKGPCCPTLDLYLLFGWWLRFTQCYFRYFVFIVAISQHFHIQLYKSDVKLIRYQFWRTRCAFRILKSLQWYSGQKSWKSEQNDCENSTV
jgi:hypothetical protein